jgi:hypothetical protein
MDQAAKLAQAVVEAWDMAHRGPFGISSESWAIVLATFAGPIVAILITLRRDASAKILERRLWVFRTLLATRGQFVNVEHVRALNLIEIEFHAVRPVMQAWRDYMAHLNSLPGGKQLEGEEFTSFHDKCRDLMAKLLGKMAAHLGFQMSEIDLRLGYAPSGWMFRDGRETELREAAISLLSGRSPLVVRAEASPSKPG